MYPKHLRDALERRYGPGAIYGFKRNHPEQFAKALRTAQREGPSHVAPHGTGRNRAQAPQTRQRASDPTDHAERRAADGRRHAVMRRYRKHRA